MKREILSLADIRLRDQLPVFATIVPPPYRTLNEERAARYNLSLKEQLVEFIETSEVDDRHWLRSPDINVYVRKNVREIVPTPIIMYYPDTGEQEQIHRKTECLDIANFELADNNNFKPWENFMSMVYKYCPWEGFYIDNIDDPRVKEWCEEQGWNHVTKKLIESHSRPSYYLVPQIGELITSQEVELYHED